MGGATWVQEKTEFYEGELVVFRRANSPNWYMRVYIPAEKKHYQKSLRTANQYEAVEKAKVEYKIIQQKVAREEKVFTITFKDAIEGYLDSERTRERRGMIGKDWLLKKHQYVKNIFAPFFGLEVMVNSITDKQMEEYIDSRLRKCKRKQTILQEITIIRHFYKSYLIAKGYATRVPAFPEFKITNKDKSRRTDTFTREEIQRLLRFMTHEWCFRSSDERYYETPKVRKAVKVYGKASNVEKQLNDWEWDMEMHRRHLIMYSIMILILTGIRAPGELLNLRWCDISFVRRKIDDRNKMAQPMNILPMDEMIEIWHRNRTIAVNIDKIVEEWFCNDQGEVDASVIHVRDGKTGSRNVPCFLSGLFHQLEEYYGFMGYTVERNSDAPVFMELYGRRKHESIDKYVFNRMFRELMRDAGLHRIKFTPYHFRHYFITERIRAGTPVPMLAKLCGNSPNVIYSTYEHVMLEDNMEVLHRV